MPDLKSQKRIAADIMDVGEDRVWIDPDDMEKVDEAITRQDIRNLIEGGTIQKRDVKGTSKGRAREKKKQKSKGRQKGQGSRKGKKSARKDDKEEWMEKIRALRAELKEMKEEDKISNNEYRELYNKAKGGFFRNKKHLNTYVEEEVKR
jgi:large subunit ribosomal protein L19e